MKIIKSIISNDNTKKYYFRSLESDSHHIEACLLNLQKYGYIICVSTQIGCSQKCEFCAASSCGLVRNLSSQEIQAQVELIINDNPKINFANFQITYMGSGEPLSNLNNVFDSIDKLRKKFIDLGKVNISTTFPLSAKTELEKIDWGKYYNFLHFQYSLHFTNDERRHNFISNNLMDISAAIDCLNYISNLVNDVYKINYIPFNNLNDDEKNANDLIEILKTAKHANLKISEMSQIHESILMPSQSFDVFCAYLQTRTNNVEIFSSDGTDINAGCGQFYNESIL